MHTQDMIDLCLRHAAVAGIDARPMAAISEAFQRCLRAGAVRDAVRELLLFAYFLERRRGMPAPARQLLALARTGAALLARSGESLGSVLASEESRRRRALLALSPTCVQPTSSDGVTALTLRAGHS